MVERYNIFKKGVTTDKIIIIDYLLGICKVDQIVPETLRERYGSMPYTKNYDDLPLTLRLWLPTKSWQRVVDLVEQIGCGNVIFYSDLLEVGDYTSDEYYMLGMPLIVAGEEHAVCLAPQGIRPSHFEVKHEFDLDSLSWLVPTKSTGGDL